MLTACLDQRQYESKQELIITAFVEVAFATRIRSSANKRREIGEQLQAILIPFRRS
jgi:hypothetical protein